VANAPGVIDPDYRGEIKVLLYNGGYRAEYVNHGERVAQLLVIPFNLIPLLEVEALSFTGRDTKGFGSSGV
jgi:dUTP pyrophosphatase